MTLEEQIRALRELCIRKDELRVAYEAAKAEYDIAHIALWDRMDATGVDSVKIDGYGYSKNTPKVYGHVADRSALYEWAVTEGNAPELFQSEPRDKLVTELVRQRLDNNEGLPPGVNFYTRPVVSQRKAAS